MRRTVAVAAVLVAVVLVACGSADGQGRPSVGEMVAAMPRYGDGTRAYARCMAEVLHASSLSDDVLRAMLDDQDYEPPLAERKAVRTVSARALAACSREITENSPVR
jgi:hypothetical protein